VEGIPVCGKQPPFAGRLWNVSLGRSTSSAGVSSLVGARTGDKCGCPEDAEEGNVVACLHSRGTHRTRGLSKDRHSGPGRTRPSLGPRIRARRSSLHTGGESRSVVARSRRYRSRANLAEARRNRLRGRRHRTQRGSPRAAAPAREKAPARKKRKVVMAIVPARSESRLVRARTSIDT
jgi:hypothetical protein